MGWPLPYAVTVHVLFRPLLLFIAFLSSLSHSSHVSFLSSPLQSYEQMNERGIKNIALNGGYLLCPQLGPSSIKILQFSTFLEKNPSMVLILTLKQMAGWSNNTFFISTWLKGPGSDTGASNTFIPCFSRRLG